MTLPDDAEAQEEAGEALPHDEADAAADPGPEGLEAVAVTLTFQLGRRSVDLGALRGMGPGTVVDLGLDPADPVEIRANGTRIAHGEIVEIGERLGVRIVRLAGRDRGA